MLFSFKALFELKHFNNLLIVINISETKMIFHVNTPTQMNFKYYEIPSKTKLYEDVA